MADVFLVTCPHRGEPVAASTLIGGGLVLVGVFTVQQA